MVNIDPVRTKVGKIRRPAREELGKILSGGSPPAERDRAGNFRLLLATRAGRHGRIFCCLRYLSSSKDFGCESRRRPDRIQNYQSGDGSIEPEQIDIERPSVAPKIQEGLGLAQQDPLPRAMPWPARTTHSKSFCRETKWNKKQPNRIRRFFSVGPAQPRAQREHRSRRARCAPLPGPHGPTLSSRLFFRVTHSCSDVTLFHDLRECEKNVVPPGDPSRAAGANPHPNPGRFALSLSLSL